MNSDNPSVSPPRTSNKAITIVPISTLPPTSSDSSTPLTFVSGVIALLFPYSSTTQTLRLVLAEEDPRLRANKGQLRISFHGKAAREVTSRELQIGDKLTLGLEGGGWYKLKNVKEGKELGWSLRFEGGVMGWVRGEEVKVEGEEAKPKVSEDADEGKSGRGVSPAGSVISTGSQREWKIPTGSRSKRREYTPARGDARELFDDEEELLREMEREEKEKEGVEPVRKRPRFSMGRYRVIRGDEEDLPSSEMNKENSVAGDSQREGSVEALSGNDKMDETPLSRVEVTPSLPTVSVTDLDQQLHQSHEPSGLLHLKPVDSGDLKLVSPLGHGGLNFSDSPPTVSITGPGQQQPNQSQEPPDSPHLKPVDSFGLAIVSPLEHGGLTFSDYMDTSSSAKSDVDFSGLKGHLVHEERLGISRREPEITLSRPQSAGYDSTGPNSLFDSLSPSPDPENRSRGRSPVVQPSPLRNVQTVGSRLRRGMGMQGEWEDGRNKAPLLLPGRAMTARAVGEDGTLEEKEKDASREGDTAQGGGDEQGEEDYLMSVPRSTTRALNDLLTRGTTQSTTQTQSDNMSPSTASGDFQSGITTIVCTFLFPVCGPM